MKHCTKTVEIRPHVRNRNGLSRTQVTDMRGMFYQAERFNDDLKLWDVSSLRPILIPWRTANGWLVPSRFVDGWHGMFTNAAAFQRKRIPPVLRNLAPVSQLFTATPMFS